MVKLKNHYNQMMCKNELHICLHLIIYATTVILKIIRWHKLIRNIIYFNWQLPCTFFTTLNHNCVSQLPESLEVWEMSLVSVSMKTSLYAHTCGFT